MPVQNPDASPAPVTDAAQAAGPIDLFGRFVHALCDPESGTALHGLHAADAPVRHGEGIGTAGEIDAELFAAAHRDLSRRGAEHLPAFTPGAFVRNNPANDRTEAVAWFELTESRTARRLFAALGVRTVNGMPRVVWCCPSERVLPWSFRDGLLQSLADYPWMRRHDPATPRALLDAGYFRRFWRAPVTFATLSDARFSCRKSSACCRHDYEITLPAEAQLLIDAMPYATMAPQLSGTRLPVRPDGTLQLKTPDETCRFLGPRNQCLIHKTLGRQPFRACCVFPFSFARTPEGIAVGLSPVCGSARAGLGIAPTQRTEDLHERLAHAEPRSTGTYRLAPGRAISWESFRDIEKGLCDCLAIEEIPLRRRLYVGARLLGALTGGVTIDMPAWRNEPLPPLKPELRAAIHGMLTRLLGWNRAVLLELPREIPANLPALEVTEAPMMARILRNTIFCKVYSYPLDLTTALNYAIVLYVLALLMQAAADGPLTERMWRELGSLGVHGLLKTMLHDDMPENFRTLLGRSEFGLWILAA